MVSPCMITNKSMYSGRTLPNNGGQQIRVGKNRGSFRSPVRVEWPDCSLSEGSGKAGGSEDLPRLAKIRAARQPRHRRRRYRCIGRSVPCHVYAQLRRRSVLGGRGRRVRDDDDVGAAERARGVAAEPGVDALDVEAVAAARQRAGLLPGLELGEADRAVPAHADRDHGYRGEHRGVEPARRGRGAVAVLAGSGDGQAPEQAAAAGGDAAAAGAVVKVQRDERQEHARERPRRGEQEPARDFVQRRVGRVTLGGGGRRPRRTAVGRKMDAAHVARGHRVLHLGARAAAVAGAHG
ncbi:hypothetical protein PAHAL_5G391500 [Panicum hallii]|uniref:Uncharacterized protein n=1 Tax=Panicum hallii TaxID=206008 RepID=A0A2T8IMN9_9POAL|nr:hypothetical protein PAHAL_5G391500 [Panicum hallii]